MNHFRALKSSLYIRWTVLVSTLGPLFIRTQTPIRLSFAEVILLLGLPFD